jgi:MtrB/PioB family decaheme-associated outer membrane protein
MVAAMAMTLLGLVTPVTAEIEVGSYRLDGDVQVGVGAFIDEPSPSRRAKYEEYRDVPGGVFLGGLRLRLFDPSESYSAEIGGTNWGRRDQEYFLLLERLGRWQGGFEWDQIPHLLSTNARLLATETSPNVFTLPTPRPQLTAYNTAPGLDEIGVRWDIARIWFQVSPTSQLDLKAEYTRIFKEGTRPFGVAMGSPGNNFYEVLQPIDQTIHDIRLTGTWAGEKYQLQAGYAFSLFSNGVRSLTVDNPCFGGPAGCGGDGAGAMPQGRMSLAPDNTAHNIFISGGLSLPMRTRLTGNFAYGVQLQNDTFLPHTVNPGLAANPVLALPQPSLEGHVQTILLNLGAVSRPLPPLKLSARYRFFDFDDQTEDITFPGHVVSDRTLDADPRLVERYGYTRHNLDGDARWTFSSAVSGIVGAGWEKWDRSRTREVRQSDEAFVKAGLDLNPTDWAEIRLTYRPSMRRIGRYNTFAHAGHEVEEDPVASTQFQSQLLRKFDEADRNRQRVDLEVSLTPIDTVTVTGTGSYRYDDYFNSVLGLQQSTSWTAGIDVSWHPAERVSFFAGYVYERYDSRMRSRSRPIVGANPALDFADFDWVSDNIDTTGTFHAGVNAVLIPQVLDLRIAGSYENSLGRIKTFNPVTPVSGNAAQRITASAAPFPAFEDNILRTESSLRYTFLKNWSATFQHIWESYQKNDWRTDRLDPFETGVSSIWLGNDLKNYSAHWLGIVLGYKF